MARLTADREALLSEEERRRLFRSMMLSRLCMITLVFCVLCWIICATIGPIAFLDQRPVAFWLIPAGIFAINYYAYAISRSSRTTQTWIAGGASCRLC